MASPATSVVLSSARRTEYLTGLTVIPVCFAKDLDTKLADAPISNKIFALVAAALPANIIRKYLIRSSGSPFDAVAARILHVMNPASAETRSATEGRYRTCTRSGIRTTDKEPSSCSCRTRPPFGTVNIQRKSFNKDMSIGIDCLVRTQTEVPKGSNVHAERV